jgi:hypothetical protein
MSVKDLTLPREGRHNGYMTTTETLIGTTTRDVTFIERGLEGITRPHRIAAGVKVYVTRVKDDGTCTIRICGSLLEQRVQLFTTVEPS